jgi:predicted RNA binding protein YcfA (HicA-like mRNA interferase family)
MPELPVVSGAEAIEAFAYFGYQPVRQKGSHVRLKCPGRPTISVPLHDPVKRGLLRGIIRDAGLTVEQFCEGLDAR